MASLNGRQWEPTVTLLICAFIGHKLVPVPEGWVPGPRIQKPDTHSSKTATQVLHSLCNLAGGISPMELWYQQCHSCSVVVFVHVFLSLDVGVRFWNPWSWLNLCATKAIGGLVVWDTTLVRDPPLGHAYHQGLHIKYDIFKTTMSEVSQTYLVSFVKTVSSLIPCQGKIWCSFSYHIHFYIEGRNERKVKPSRGEKMKKTKKTKKTQINTGYRHHERIG